MILSVVLAFALATISTFAAPANVLDKAHSASAIQRPLTYPDPERTPAGVCGRTDPRVSRMPERLDWYTCKWQGGVGFLYEPDRHCYGMGGVNWLWNEHFPRGICYFSSILPEHVDPGPLGRCDPYNPWHIWSPTPTDWTTCAQNGGIGWLYGEVRVHCYGMGGSKSTTRPSGTGVCFFRHHVPPNDSFRSGSCMNGEVYLLTFEECGKRRGSGWHNPLDLHCYKPSGYSVPLSDSKHEGYCYNADLYPGDNPASRFDHYPSHQNILSPMSPVTSEAASFLNFPI